MLSFDCIEILYTISDTLSLIKVTESLISFCLLFSLFAFTMLILGSLVKKEVEVRAQSGARSRCGRQEDLSCSHSADSWASYKN